MFKFMQPKKWMRKNVVLFLHIQNQRVIRVSTLLFVNELERSQIGCGGARSSGSLQSPSKLHHIWSNILHGMQGLFHMIWAMYSQRRKTWCSRKALNFGMNEYIMYSMLFSNRQVWYLRLAYCTQKCAIHKVARCRISTKGGCSVA